MAKHKKSVVSGAILGYLGTRAFCKRNPDKHLYVGKKNRRIHHYWALLGAALPLSPTAKGLFLGAGLQDFPDLKDEVVKRVPKRKTKKFINKR